MSCKSKKTKSDSLAAPLFCKECSRRIYILSISVAITGPVKNESVEFNKAKLFMESRYKAVENIY